ncbi:hypothetical protein BJY01DRAFT_249750 [Aspergillus pseudoustus]|uniref:Uncharacterized protein n=1 Tax=Aspergillus pseudoustus TaxID=1810923 RepID=A0ABR4JLX0_9EURO
MAAVPSPEGPGGPENQHFRVIIDHLRQVRGAGSGTGGFTLWGGVIMSMIPAANPGVDMSPLFDSFLSGLTFQELLSFTEAFPALLIHIHRWGLHPKGTWARMPLLNTPQEVINWHLAVAPEGTPIPAPGDLIPMNIVTMNQMTRNWPIVSWMIRSRTNFLRRLHAHGLWNPLGYHPNGESWLVYATAHNYIWMRDYIARVARTKNLIALMQPTIVAEVSGIATGMNYFDYAISTSQWNIFWDWWRNNPGMHGPTILSTRSQETLCKIVTAAEAQYLLTNNALNLAVQPPPAVITTSAGVPAGLPYLIGYVRQVGSPGFGSPWHLAVRNPNTDFMDFFAAQSANNNLAAIAAANANIFGIDNPAGYPHTALGHAWRLRAQRHFEKLLALGAGPGTTPQRMIREWPHYKDPWLRAALAGVRTPTTPHNGAVFGGTILHWVVDELHRRVVAVQGDNALTAAQKRNARRRLVKHAERLLAVAKLGNVRGRPDVSTMDMRIPPRTAWDVARRRGYRELAYLLDHA